MVILEGHQIPSDIVAKPLQDCILMSNSSQDRSNRLPNPETLVYALESTKYRKLWSASPLHSFVTGSQNIITQIVELLHQNRATILVYVVW